MVRNLSGVSSDQEPHVLNPVMIGDDGGDSGMIIAGTGS